MSIRSLPQIVIAGSAAALMAGAAQAEDNADSSADLPDETAAIQSAQPPARSGPPPGVAMQETVFDDTWITVGIGAGIVPTYSGSDDYEFFPLPLVVGRVGGVGISPNGPGFTLDVLSKPPSGPSSKPRFAFGPSFRIRNDRDGDAGDPVVDLAPALDTALELGVSGGVSFPGVFNRFDSLSISSQVRWDVLGAHDGMLVEPGVSYFTPLGRGAAVQLAANASFVDDDFAEFYYSVTPALSAATGLAPFTAEGGLNSLGVIAIATVDLDGNAMNGGFNIYGIGGYSRLVGDAADTPFTAERGSANQFIGGLGIGYTF